MLIIGAVFESHDALVRAGFAIAEADDGGFDADCIAVKQGVWEADVIPAKVRDGGAQRGFCHRDADHQRQGETGIYQPLAVFGFGAAVFLVQMKLGGIVGHGGEEHVVGFGDRAADRVVEFHPDFQFVEPFACHWGPPFCRQCSRGAMAVQVAMLEASGGGICGTKKREVARTV